MEENAQESKQDENDQGHKQHSTHHREIILRKQKIIEISSQNIERAFPKLRFNIYAFLKSRSPLYESQTEGPNNKSSASFTCGSDIVTGKVHCSQSGYLMEINLQDIKPRGKKLLV